MVKSKASTFVHFSGLQGLHKPKLRMSLENYYNEIIVSKFIKADNKGHVFKSISQQ